MQTLQWNKLHYTTIWWDPFKRTMWLQMWLLFWPLSIILSFSKTMFKKVDLFFNSAGPSWMDTSISFTCTFVLSSIHPLIHYTYVWKQFHFPNQCWKHYIWCTASKIVLCNWWPTRCKFLVYLFVPNQLYMFRTRWNEFHLVHYTGRQQHRWTTSKAVNRVKCSWWWVKTLPETCTADWIQINKPKSCILLVINYELS